MKIKHLIIIFFFTYSSGVIYSQTIKKLYQVTIFKWTKTDNVDLKKLVKIDSLGNVFVDNKIIDKKVNLKTFTKGVNKFMENENLEKIPRNFNPPKAAIIPKNNEQSIYVSIILLGDFHNENNEGNRTYYSWKMSGLKNTDAEYSLYKYLKKNDLELLKSLLL